MKKIALILLSTILINNSFASEEDFFDIDKPAKIQKANAEFVYKFLLAEIAAQRGDLTSAGHLYYDLAKLTKISHLHKEQQISQDMRVMED